MFVTLELVEIFFKFFFKFFFFFLSVKTRDFLNFFYRRQKLFQVDFFFFLHSK